jgi:hypothetical protein
VGGEHTRDRLGDPWRQLDLRTVPPSSSVLRLGRNHCEAAANRFLHEEELSWTYVSDSLAYGRLGSGEGPPTQGGPGWRLMGGGGVGGGPGGGFGQPGGGGGRGRGGEYSAYPRHAAGWVGWAAGAPGVGQLPANPSPNRGCWFLGALAAVEGGEGGGGEPGRWPV